MDEDSNHSCSSVGSRKKIKRSFSQSSTSQQNSRDVREGRGRGGGGIKEERVVNN